MCTAFGFKTRDRYFARNLDLDISYSEEVVVLPRNYKLNFRCEKTLDSHYAMMGIATVVGGEPLFYDAANECGLAMAGLNFPNNAHYFSKEEERDNITPFEFIPWVLAKCKNIEEAKALLASVNLVDIPFSEKLPLSPLHWIIADGTDAVTVESTKSGLQVYDNPAALLTNNPPFPSQLNNLSSYRNLKNYNPESTFSKEYKLEEYCLGLGAVGLPGDPSSMSRFVRAAFNKTNSVCPPDENSSVSQVFHILSSVEMTKGACRTNSGKYDITVYSSCINTDKGLYYYTTYGNRRINCVDMHKEDLEAASISRFPLIKEAEINIQN